MKPKCKYKLSLNGSPQHLWLVNAEFKEVPPQKRMVMQDFIPARKYVQFPFLQFYLFELYAINLKFKKSTHFCVSGSVKSIYDGGERMSLRLPNCQSGGGVCLGAINYNTLDEGIKAWWHTEFSGPVSYEANDMLYDADETEFGWFYPTFLNENHLSKHYTWELNNE